jgi:RNA polymerase sigma-70 factor (ECF subfamily)
MADPPFDMAECLARVRLGDQEAATSLVARLHPLVLKLVRAHRALSATDDDLVQEVFLAMFTRLERYTAHDGIPFEHWLSRLAVNVCIDVLRAEKRRPKPAALSAAAAGWLENLVCDRAAPVEDALAARELVAALLARLSPPDRLVLTLLDLEGRSTSEVAAATGWSRTLVKVRTFRARHRLRALALRLSGEGQERPAHLRGPLLERQDGEGG